MIDLKASFTFLEIYPVYVACVLWGKMWSTRKILFHSDNEGTFEVWRSGSSRHPRIMELRRRIHFVDSQCDFVVKMVHIQGKKNNIANSLSQGKRFRELTPGADNCGLMPPDLFSRLRPFLNLKKRTHNMPPLSNCSTPEWLLLHEELTPMKSVSLRNFAASQM